MHSQDFFSSLQDSGAVLSESSDGVSTVEHFGDIAGEANAASSACVVCPLQQLIQLRVSGKDRAKFLHSFCTNNITALQTGQACEAFFTDVKAKVLAHGFVLASADTHEIWMLPGDQAALLAHLNRYIITEDVTIESVEDSAAFAVIGPESNSVLQSAGFSGKLNADGCVVEPEFGQIHLLWAGTDVTLLSVKADSTATTWQKLIDNGAAPSGNVVFEHFRILEGYPLVGFDITGENLAPEADRNQQTISYTKGCYLGQEPIARLDAMGHVNRQLYRAKARISDSPVSDANAVVPTSFSRVDRSAFPVLLLLPVKIVTAAEALAGSLPDGTPIEIRV